MLSFLPGEVGTYLLQPSMRLDTALCQVGRLLRRMHDATVGYDSPGAPWQQVYPDPSHHEGVCHNDGTLYNTVFVDGQPHAFIDFDTAGPGPRIWDVVYAACTFVPLAKFVPLSDSTTVPYEATRHAESRHRLQLLCDSYGLERAGDPIRVVERRLHALCTTLVDRAAAGDAAYQRLIDDGHLAHYQAEVVFV